MIRSYVEVGDAEANEATLLWLSIWEPAESSCRRGL